MPHTTRKRRTKKTDIATIRNLVVISDIHAGCRLALCPPAGVKLDDGGTYMPSDFQRTLWQWWEDFWRDMETWTKGEPYAVVFNGDAMDGVHHRSTTQISHNLEDQQEIAYAILKPVVERCDGRYYHIRGTEAHVGSSAREEESLAKRLGAIPNREGQHARYEIWKYLGDQQVLCHILHHIGTTGSMAYETTAVMKEIVESYSEAGRWGRRPPDVVIRSHRHRSIKVEVPTHNRRGVAVTTPAWQGKTPFAWKIPGARQSQPQFGGLLVRIANSGNFDVHRWTRDIEREQPE